ncbi:MAG: hypothetical protein AAF557_18870 [Pseudomonadota bacterium]
MSSEGRFSEMKKVPDAPASKFIAHGHVRLKTKLDAGPDASVEEVLTELYAKDKLPEVLLMLANCLPPREAVWWACVCARDMYPENGEEQPETLTTAEAWVFKPSEETRVAARLALDASTPGDKTKLCAQAACFADGTLGPGELEDYETPPGGFGASVFGMVMRAMYSDKAKAMDREVEYVDRAVDIGRGGNGKKADETPAKENA